MVRPPALSSSKSTILSLGLSLGPHSSPISEAFTYLWFTHLCGRGLSRRPRWLAPSRTVVLLPSLPSRASVCHSRPTSHTPSRKLSKSLSFFPLRDSYGTTQLVVHAPVGDPSLDGDVQQSNHVTELARIPVESTVLVQGHVRLRPQKQRRPVITHLIPLGSQTTDSPIALSRAPLVMSRFP